MSEAILSTQKMTKRFGGLQAISELNIEIDDGSISSIIGPNGAGKTTCFNCITGYYKPEEGQIIFRQKPITGLLPHNIANLGISRTYQNIRLFANITAIENIMTGRHCQMKSSFIDALTHTPRHVAEEREALDETHRILDFIGLRGCGDNLARNLPYGAQRRLEIARAIANKPRLLLLDEPSAGMNPSETQEMVTLIRKLRDELGITILLIEHDMSLIMTISEKVIVLDFGRKIAEGKPEQVQKDPLVIEAYLGRAKIENL